MSDEPQADRVADALNDARFPDGGEHVTLVHCTYCNKTHAVIDTDPPCAPDAWIDPEPIR